MSSWGVSLVDIAYQIFTCRLFWLGEMREEENKTKGEENSIFFSPSHFRDINLTFSDRIALSTQLQHRQVRIPPISVLNVKATIATKAVKVSSFFAVSSAQSGKLISHVDTDPIFAFVFNHKPQTCQRPRNRLLLSPPPPSPITYFVKPWKVWRVVVVPKLRSSSRDRQLQPSPWTSQLWYL